MSWYQRPSFDYTVQLEYSIFCKFRLHSLSISPGNGVSSSSELSTVPLFALAIEPLHMEFIWTYHMRAARKCFLL